MEAVVLLNFCLLNTNWSHLGKGNLREVTFPIRLACRRVCGGGILLVANLSRHAQTTVGGAILIQVGLRYVRTAEETKQAISWFVYSWRWKASVPAFMFLPGSDALVFPDNGL